MQTPTLSKSSLLALASALLLAGPAAANIYLQCPAPLLTQNATGGICDGGVCTLDPKNPAASTDPGCLDPEAPDFFQTCRVLMDSATGQPSGETTDPAVVCRSVTCGDGHVNMADGSDQYIFGFHDTTNAPESKIATAGFFYNSADESLSGTAEFSAPTLFAREGQRLYLTLTNVGFRERPDLTDPHTIHYHGFPNAAAVFDGEPMSSFGVNMGSSLTYFYDNQNAGTYMWHCHVEAAEHMQMGMLGNLYVLPAQDGTTLTHAGRSYTRFAYNDCPTRGAPLTPADPMCGSTGYDVMYFLQQSGFDPRFHNADATYQKLDFSGMTDTYPMLNGRGYPDTVNPDVLINGSGAPSQPTPAIPFAVDAEGRRSAVTIPQGSRLLLRLSSLATTGFYTVTVLGIPMRVVGQGAQLLRGPGGTSTAYTTSSVTLSGGQAVDVILDTTGVPAGTYFLYTTNLNHLSNDAEDYGGMMTELVVN